MADTNTVVGQTILIKGNLQGDEDLTVQGRIEGSVHLTKTLIVEPTGVVKADVSVCNAVISGVMVGNLTATDSVELSETGRMVGDIRAPRIIITEGALFKGQVDMGDLESSRSGGESKAQPIRMPLSRFEPVKKAVPGKGAPARAAAPKAAPPKAEPKPEPKVEKKALADDEETTPAKKKVVVKKRR